MTETDGAVSVPIDTEAVQNSVLYADHITIQLRRSGGRRRRLVHHPAEVGGQPDRTERSREDHASST